MSRNVGDVVAAAAGTSPETLRLQEIEARLRAAPAGPWSWSHSYELVGLDDIERKHWCLHNPESEAEGMCIDGFLVLDSTEAVDFVGESIARRPAFQLIANAPTDIAWLIEQLREAKPNATPVPPPPSPETAPPRNAIQEHFADVANGRDDEASVAGNPARNPTDARRLAERITEYLSAGGLFNPEMMEHGKVRDLLIDCRAAISIPADAVTDEDVRQALIDSGYDSGAAVNIVANKLHEAMEMRLALEGFASRRAKTAGRAAKDEGAHQRRTTYTGDGRPLAIEREFFCHSCNDFRDVRQNQGDVVCEACDSIVATFKDREIIPPAPGGRSDD